MPIKKGHKIARSAAKQSAKSKRVPLQQAGEPQGKHLTGFKGMKVDATCRCGGCHPNAVAKKDQVKVIQR